MIDISPHEINVIFHTYTIISIQNLSLFFEIMINDRMQAD